LGEDYRKGIRGVLNYCKTEKITPEFYAITKEQLPLLQEVLADVFKKDYRLNIRSPRDFFDYFYPAAQFVSFAGNKLHGQRNHLNYFVKTYDYSFEKLTPDNLPDVRQFFGSFMRSKDSDLFFEERIRTSEVLNNHALYGMEGGVLRVNGAVAGFTMGEVYGDTLYIHIEKADTQIRGAYQALVSNFVRSFGDRITYVNREEDVGDEGLRQSKLAYHPIELLEKAMVKVMVDTE
jgi:hypothetical protein